MPVVKLDTGFNIEIVLPVAAFFRRLLAWLIDGTIQITYLWVMGKLFSGLITSEWNWMNIILYLPVFLYHLIFEMLMNGQSPGKKIVGIRVITLEGGQPSASQYTIRWTFKIIDFPIWVLAAVVNGFWPPWAILFLFLGLFCIIITKASQRIGDAIAGTVLIDTKTNTSWQDTVFMEVEENYKPVFPQVMLLSDRDINSIKQVLSTSDRRPNSREYAERIAHKIQHALKIETTLDPVDFMELLLKDYNHLSAKA